MEQFVNLLLLKEDFLNFSPLLFYTPSNLRTEKNLESTSHVFHTLKDISKIKCGRFALHMPTSDSPPIVARSRKPPNSLGDELHSATNSGLALQIFLNELCSMGLHSLRSLLLSRIRLQDHKNR